MKQLGLFDINRLSEMVSIYLNPPGEFTIFRNGEVSLNKASLFRRTFNVRDDETLDFLEVAQNLSDKIIAVKKDNPLVQVLCGEAVGVLIDTNERNEVIKKLYTAHLVDESLSDKTLFGKKNQQQNNRAQQTRIELVPQPKIIRAQVYDNRSLRMQLAENIADAMNHADTIYIAE